MTLETSIRLEPTRPDAEVAADLKKRAESLLGQLCGLMDEAKRAGLELNFSIGRTQDQSQRAYVSALTVSKYL